MEELHGIYIYLQGLEKEELDTIFRNVWVCKSIFRNVDDIAKQYIMISIFKKENENIPITTYSTIIKSTQEKEKEIINQRTLNILYSLRVFQ
jgi:hypothetical protein